MAELKDKVKLALDEARTLILGAQILLGFQYKSFLQPSFDALPNGWRVVQLAALAAILGTVCMLMWPATFQQLAERGEATSRLHRFTSRVSCFALLPFAAAMGLDLFLVFGKAAGTAAGVTAGVVVCGAALFFWYGLGFRKRAQVRREGGGQGESGKDDHARRAMNSAEQPGETQGQTKEPNTGGTSLKDQITDLLTESRVILPGAQALLGFQFIVLFEPGFDKLPATSQGVHLASLALLALSTILLLTPPAYHRIVEDGEYTQRFCRFASRVVMAAMVPLAAGMAGEFYVVARKVIVSPTWSASLAGGVFVLILAAWFGYTLYRRQQLEHASRPPRQSALPQPAVG